MSENNGGPWGGGNRGNQGKNNGDQKSGDKGKRPAPPHVPEIDEIVKKGQEQLRMIMGGNGSGNDGEGGVPKSAFALAVLAAVGFWAFSSFYTVKPEEQSVELFLGEFSSIGNSGLNFAPWPFVTAEVVPVTNEQIVDIGTGSVGTDAGLMLTGDENVVDIDFQVVWNISDPAKYLFNLSDPPQTIAAVSESAMREIVAQSELAPILNRDRAVIASRLQDLIQSTLDSYESGVNVVRVNFDKADPPRQVIDAFRDVQAAEQERDKLQNQADAYKNSVLAEARGEAARLREQAEGYRAQVVNEAEGEASRFSAVLAEYLKAPEVTRKRLYLETMEKVLGRIDKVILDQSSSEGQDVVPFLPLNDIMGRNSRSGGTN